MPDTDESMRRAAARAAQREWDWSNPRCPLSDLQHPPDEHLPECFDVPCITSQADAP